MNHPKLLAQSYDNIMLMHFIIIKCEIKLILIQMIGFNYYSNNYYQVG